jgi:hypothetical protein
MSVERVGSLGASLTVSGGSLHLGLVLLLSTCVGRRELFTYPAKRGTWHVQTLRKVSTEVTNLSKGEMCSNYSLIICPRFLQPFTALPEGWALKALRSRISCSGTSRGPAVDVFNFGGGRCRTLPPAPHGVHHRRLQLRRWPLSDLAASTPGARHRRLQLLNL